MISVFEISQSFLLLDDNNDGEGLTNLKLQKLVYYAQGFYLAMFDKPLFAEPIEAWTHGPVVPKLYHAYKQYGQDCVPISDDFSLEQLNHEIFELLNEVYCVFGQYTAWKLRDMTHEELPWKNHEYEGSMIPHSELKSYFKTRLH
ncbi:MAG: SocA family protein [Thiomargarita sp.]|nr:SocA family protein [Bacteroidales bacterium]MCK5717065.1 SocA family protein [Thiomargarita sp.]